MSAPAFFLRVTAAGIRKLVLAENGGPRLQLSQMVIGDGGGSPVAPDETRTQLVRETYRAMINDSGISDTDPSIVLAEGVIPADVGGFVLREIGLLDADGVLVYVGNFPETYKPLASDGATREMIVRAALKVGNADLVQFALDPSIVLATRDWVMSNLTLSNLFPGGTIGNIWTKLSNNPGDMGWRSVAASVNVVIGAITELQIAVAGQSTFDLTKMTTDGIAVYVDKQREHTFAVPTATRVQLDRQLNAGQTVFFVQNEPNEPLQLKRQAIYLSLYLGSC